MAYDDVILRMGEFGRYQRRIYVLLCLPAIICAFHKMGGVFLGPKMTTRCLLPWEENNASFVIDPVIMNGSYPLDEKQGRSQCTRRVNLTGYVPEGAEGGGNTGSTGDPTRTSSDGLMTCREFVFDTSIYKSTTTSEWNLVCDKAWLRAVGDSLFMVGVMLGSIIFGGLSDKFGRRPIFFLSLVIQLVGGLLVAVAPEYISYVIFRLIVGSTTSGVFLVAYVIALEMVGPKKRSVAGVGCQLFFTLGYILTAGFAYYIRDWRYLQIAITLPSFAFLVYWWFIPESARWLLTKGKDEEAKELLQRAAKENGIEIPRDTLDCLLHESNGDNVLVNSQASLFDLFRTPNLRRKSLLLFFNWLVNSGTYYGLSWNVNNLGGNDYVNFVILGAVEVPAYLFLIFVLERWGRKSILCGCMVVSGLALVGTIFVPEEYPWMIVVLAMIGKLAITSSYGGIYVFTAEQFPTVVRNVGLGACSTFARIGGVIAPYVNYLAEIWKPLPLVIFGACALAGGLISLMLPETLNKKLPETIEDGELFGLKDKTSKSKKDKNRELKQLDVHHLNDTDSIKPLKPVENGIHDSKQNG
ncbi:organic cation transporter protein [Microplitis mediator]|uniref:organic cation transporter protein n=1 Tax=Microplitis mediator TaxID=375433 RepID=UPI002554B987|nr:organic cation transporter protein [Microplitis mediator]XP_057338282.1 organic cation transporter protein [Microplitis mediator]XP_057338283.1 organic cation transporter protein [Microplitis mediator]XP_057338284.1 organic cation transporter protein [Microplitis mediator]XP_057338286.1 organic cation transporter protein [Microplitis mediator]XP_057338287.1 organic cation transporter protein [Microplitis mediator]